MLSSDYDTLLYIYPLIGRPKSSLLLGNRANISHIFSFYTVLARTASGWPIIIYWMTDGSVFLLIASAKRRDNHPLMRKEIATNGLPNVMALGLISRQ
jgi:hypothetical protein